MVSAQFNTKEIQSLIGKRLSNASYFVHKHTSEVTEIIALVLFFLTGEVLTIRGGSDGASLILERVPPLGFDLEEYGRTELCSVDLLDPAGITGSLNKMLRRATIACSQTVVSWIELQFDESRVSIRNSDDVLRFGEARPSKIETHICSIDDVPESDR